MSLYNMVMGFNPACVLLLPMLGRKADEYPRFRDCALTEDQNGIAILTRVGGANRGQGYGEEELESDENFIRTIDHPDDSTYGIYEFRVPDKWKSDFEFIKDGQFDKVSTEYVDQVKSFYPKLSSEGTIDKVFKR